MSVVAPRLNAQDTRLATFAPVGRHAEKECTQKAQKIRAGPLRPCVSAVKKIDPQNSQVKLVL